MPGTPGARHSGSLAPLAPHITAASRLARQLPPGRHAKSLENSPKPQNGIAFAFVLGIGVGFPILRAFLPNSIKKLHFLLTLSVELLYLYAQLSILTPLHTKIVTQGDSKPGGG